jgi:predicted nucleotidyltransferase
MWLTWQLRMHAVAEWIWMLKDQRDLLSAFKEHGVEYVVVGGHAVTAYGFSRMTKDLDVLIRDTEENAQAVFRALGSFGAPISSYTPSDFHGHPSSVIQFGMPPNRIDLLQSIDGLNTEDVWLERVELAIDSEMKVNFISLEHLIRNKQTVGRASDIADVDELKRVNKKP